MNQGVHVDIGMNLIVYISMCLDEFNFLLIYLIYFVYYVKIFCLLCKKYNTLKKKQCF